MPGVTEDLGRTIYLLQYPLQWSDTGTKKNTQSFEIQVGVGWKDRELWNKINKTSPR